MTLYRALGASLLALGLALPGAAGAEPLKVRPSVIQNDLVLPVQAEDCHSQPRRHYLQRYDQRLLHRHRQSNCRVILLEEPEEEDPEPRDCHRDVQRHYVDDLGRRVTHRHVGPNCRIREYRREDESRPGDNCIRIGPITYCEP